MSRVLERLGYVIERQRGSHRLMKCSGRPDIHLSYHDKASVAPGMVRKILVGDVGLTEQEALACM